MVRLWPHLLHHLLRPGIDSYLHNMHYYIITDQNSIYNTCMPIISGVQCLVFDMSQPFN